nr:GntR family transcriptional regulator [uncultured Thiodictyon sp.]
MQWAEDGGLSASTKPATALPPTQTIAEHFGVSRMTVSRAVNNKEQDSAVADVNHYGHR